MFLEKFPDMLREMQRDGTPVTVLFFDGSDEVLKRRFSETRRPHPMMEPGARWTRPSTASAPPWRRCATWPTA